MTQQVPKINIYATVGASAAQAPVSKVVIYAIVNDRVVVRHKSSVQVGLIPGTVGL